MSSFKTQSGLHQGENLIKVPSAFICLQNARQFLLHEPTWLLESREVFSGLIWTYRVHNDVKTTDLGESELSLLQAGGMYLLPYPYRSLSVEERQEQKIETY